MHLLAICLWYPSTKHQPVGAQKEPKSLPPKSWQNVSWSQNMPKMLLRPLLCPGPAGSLSLQRTPYLLARRSKLGKERGKREGKERRGDPVTPLHLCPPTFEPWRCHWVNECLSAMRRQTVKKTDVSCGVESDASSELFNGVPSLPRLARSVSSESLSHSTPTVYVT